MPAQRGPATSRRTALAGAAAGVLASACDAGGPREPDPEPGPEPTAAADPDALLVASAATLVAEQLALARALGDRYPRLAPGLRPFVALHRAHAQALPPPEEDPPPPAVAGGASAEAARFRAREARTVRRLARWAVAARSGALARLLASMSAGTAAHLAAAEPAGTDGEVRS